MGKVKKTRLPEIVKANNFEATVTETSKNVFHFTVNKPVDIPPFDYIGATYTRPPGTPEHDIKDEILQHFFKNNNAKS